MIALATAHAHFVFAALLLVVGLGVAASARDFLKRLLGAVVAAIAGTAHLLVLAPQASGGGLAAIVLMLAGAALGCVLCVRLRETFGGLDSAQVLRGLDADADLADREAG